MRPNHNKWFWFRSVRVLLCHNPGMVVAAAAEAVQTPAEAVQTSCSLLDIIETALHARQSEWLFLRELRVGTGTRNNSAQRVDAFALNTLPHLGMKRICYEVKVSRADFFCEIKQPLKRRIGMRYSNEFYFVTPPDLLKPGEVPVECGLIEAGRASAVEWRALMKRQTGFFHFDPACGAFCVMTVPAPWRDTPGPTWQFVAAMMRHQRRSLEEKPPPRPVQGRLSFNT